MSQKECRQWLQLRNIVVALCAMQGGSVYTKSNPVKLSVQSTAFVNGGMIPQQYTRDGDDRAPQLSWQGAPKDTKSFVIICNDPDAPHGIWTHWVLFNIPPGYSRIEEGEKIPEAIAGSNSWATLGYRGPLPPKGRGTHHYNFNVFALDTLLPLTSGATANEVTAAMRNHIIGQGVLTGTYSRP